MKTYKEWFYDWDEINLMIRASIKEKDGVLTGPFFNGGMGRSWPIGTKAVDCLDEYDVTSGIYGFPYLTNGVVDRNIADSFRRVKEFTRRALEKHEESGVVVLLDFDMSSACFETDGAVENEMRAYRCNIISCHKVDDFFNDYYEPFREYMIWKAEKREKEGLYASNGNVEAAPKIDNALTDFIRDMKWSAGIHGIAHSRRVYNFGTILSQKNTSIYGKPVDIAVVRWFAYLHDCQRMFDGYDIEHGPRAAVFIDNIRKSYLKELSDEQIAKLKQACRLHTTEHKTGDLTIDTCFDADRLDLTRVGITPDPNRMATKGGAYMARCNDMKIK